MGRKMDSWAATAADSVIVPADEYRGEVRIQVLGEGAIWLGFGEPAVVGKGLFVSKGGSYAVDDHRAMLEIHAICAAGSTSAGGYQTA